ncbi:2-oxoglutarate and iron-dependent oxygenase domain-containing protein [Streptomyces sp. NPDC002577]
MAHPTALPVIDISRFRAPDTDRDTFLAELRSAAHEVGFFYVTGHGVPASLQDEVLHVARAFFALPEQRRLEIENLNSPQFRGYTRTGTEYTAGSADWREQIDIGPEREALETGPDDPDYLRLVGPNQWPSALPELRDIVLRWQAEALCVSREVLRALAAALGQDEGYFDQWFDDEAAVLPEPDDLRLPDGLYAGITAWSPLDIFATGSSAAYYVGDPDAITAQVAETHRQSGLTALILAGWPLIEEAEQVAEHLLPRFAEIGPVRDDLAATVPHAAVR